MKPEVAFDKVLRMLRQQAGYSQEQIALDDDRQRNYVSLLEHGLDSARIMTLYELATVLKTTSSRMLEQADQLQDQR